jgi:long-subunit acyl-CoA synthetase (AMP-forming)
MDDVVILSGTGGTTGMPKGVMNTHRSAQTFFAQFRVIEVAVAGAGAP